MMDCPHRPAPRIMASTVSNLRCRSASLKVNSVVSTCTTKAGTWLLCARVASYSFWVCMVLAKRMLSRTDFQRGSLLGEQPLSQAC